MTSADRDRLLRDNRRICIGIEQWTNGILAPSGLTAMQAQVLLSILRQPGTAGTSLTALCREFGCSMPTLSAQIKHLREKGYVQAALWEGDERRKRLTATEKGRALLPFLDRTARLVRRQLCGCFTDQELSALDALQQKQLRNLSALIQQAKEETQS